MHLLLHQILFQTYTVPDQLALELVMDRWEISPQDISIILGEQTEEGAQMAALAPQGGRWKTDWEQQSEGRHRLCRPMQWKPTGRLVIYPPSPERLEDVQEFPWLVLTEKEEVSAMISLAPGDSMSMTQLSYQGLPVRQLLIVDRPTGRLLLSHRNKDNRSMLCWTEAHQN